MRCEAYFRVCGIDPQVWVDTAVVHFTGPAALWLEWSQAHQKCSSWELFCACVLEKFGRSEFQHLLRKFSRLKQTGSVLEYAEQFNIMMHSLLAHHNSWDPLFFTTHFVDGLFHEIKIAVVLHRPQDLESAVALAELQEEVLEMEHPEQEAATNHRANSPGMRPRRFLSPPPLTVTVPPVPGIGRPSTSSPSPTPLETRRGLDIAKSASSTSPTVDTKLQALRAFRKARGLCFTCGERWGHNHVCASTVQLQVVQELVNMLPLPSSSELPPVFQESSGLGTSQIQRGRECHGNSPFPSYKREPGPAQEEPA